MYNHDCVPGSTDFCNPVCNPCGGPRPPMDCSYSHCGIPIPPPIAPVCPPPVPGANMAQQFAAVVSKTNECINRWNYIQENCFKALNDVVGAAKSNDVYYDCDEVRLEQGYSTADSSVYHIIRINKFDKRGCPIIVKLGLAYDNTTNSNVRQKMSDFSFVKSANAIITAVNPSQTGWNGPAMYKGMQIPGGTAEDKYIAGFNEFGVLKVYLGNIENTNLCQDKIVDMIGEAIPIVLDGEITSQAQSLTSKMAVCAIGYNSSICQRIMLFTGCQDNPGMQGITVANVMKELGCTTAVITAMQDTTAENGSIGMSYMGRWTDSPLNYETPENVAFWYVSKRPDCGYKNDFETEIANLVQTSGMNSNGISELRDKVQTAQDTADTALDLAQTNADKIQVLEGEVEDLSNRMETAESNITNLQNDLRKEISDRINADNTINTRIDNEITDRENGDNQLQQNINQEAQAREDADDALGSRIDGVVSDIGEINNSITEINNDIDNIINGSTQLTDYVKKTGDTMSGPLVLSGNPTQANEAANKGYVDSKLTSLPVATASTLGAVKVGSGLNITQDGTLSATGGGGEPGGDYLPLSGGTMSGDIVMSDGTSVNYGNSGSTYNDNGNVVTKAETGKVVAMGQSFKVQNEGGDPIKIENLANGSANSDAVNFGQLNSGLSEKADKTTVEEIAENVGNLQDSVDSIIDGSEALPYVKKSGDTMTGPLVLSGNPTQANQAANKSYVDGFVKKTGDVMTGPLTLSGNPTSANQAANKAYVDSAVGEVSGFPETSNKWNHAGTITYPTTVLNFNAAYQPKEFMFVCNITTKATSTSGDRRSILQIGDIDAIVSQSDIAEVVTKKVVLFYNVCAVYGYWETIAQYSQDLRIVGPGTNQSPPDDPTVSSGIGYTYETGACYVSFSYPQAFGSGTIDVFWR